MLICKQACSTALDSVQMSDSASNLPPGHVMATLEDIAHALSELQQQCLEQVQVHKQQQQQLEQLHNDAQRLLEHLEQAEPEQHPAADHTDALGRVQQRQSLQPDWALLEQAHANAHLLQQRLQEAYLRMLLLQLQLQRLGANNETNGTH